MVSGQNFDIQKLSQTLVDVWRLLTPDEQQLLVDTTEWERIPKQAAFYHEGQTPRCLFCLEKGNVKICKTGVGGRQQIVRIVTPHQFFGYRASFIGEDYVTDAIAMEDSVALRIPLSTARTIIVANRAISIFFLQQMATYLGLATQHTVNLTQKHIRGRLAEALFRLKNTFGVADDGQTLAISASREELANLSNMTTSNAIRTLRAFAEEGLVRIDGRKITILDEQRLHTIADNG